MRNKKFRDRKMLYDIFKHFKTYMNEKLMIFLSVLVKFDTVILAYCFYDVFFYILLILIAFLFLLWLLFVINGYFYPILIV